MNERRKLKVALMNCSHSHARGYYWFVGSKLFDVVACSVPMEYRDRIFIENRSTTTDENILFCSEIAEREDLPRRFLIVTDRFHQMRAKLICRDNGVEAASLSASTPLHLLLQYWAREVLCLAERWLTK